MCFAHFPASVCCREHFSLSFWDIDSVLRYTRDKISLFFLPTDLPLLVHWPNAGRCNWINNHLGLACQ